MYNSFAETGEGHGTDRALVGGLLGMRVDDEHLKDSFEHAKAANLLFRLERRADPERHPNYVEFTFYDEGDSPFTVAGISVGGGNVRIIDVNGLKVEFSGRHDMLLLTYHDVPGMVGFIGDTLGSRGINIGHMNITRDSEVGMAYAFLKLDASCSPDAFAELRGNEQVVGVTYVKRLGDACGRPNEN
jgi:L-serine dehydratase